MKIEYIKPDEIEKRSMELIRREMGKNAYDAEELPVVMRAIHASADFDYAKNLCFSPGAVEQGKRALQRGCTIVTDTNMILSGISSAALTRLQCTARCFMAEPDVGKEAKRRGITRAMVSMERAAQINGDLIVVIGNAPTALIRLYELIQEKKIAPALIIGVPVGFVNVCESKELIKTSGVPYIVADGRKGGSTVAAAVMNAILYEVSPRRG